VIQMLLYTHINSRKILLLKLNSVRNVLPNEMIATIIQESLGLLLGLLMLHLQLRCIRRFQDSSPDSSSCGMIQLIFAKEMPKDIGKL